MSNERNAFDLPTLNELLNEIGRRLQERGASVSIYVFGGAAMVLRGLRDGMTEDIDSGGSTAPVFTEILAEIGEEFDLPNGWFSTRGYGFTPGEAADLWVSVLKFEGLTVLLASEKALLAQKLTAMRPAKDMSDIERLLRANGVTSSEQAITLVDELYDVENAVPKIELSEIKVLLEQVFPQLLVNDDDDVRAVDAAWSETKELNESPIPWEQAKRDLGLS